MALVQAYMDIHGPPDRVTIETLNAEMRRRHGPNASQYDLPRLYRWRAGSTSLPRTVERVMRDDVLPWWLMRHGVPQGDDQWQELLGIIHPPER